MVVTLGAEPSVIGCLYNGVSQLAVQDRVLFVIYASKLEAQARDVL